MMAERGRNTLILVHRRQLMDQWIERLTTFSSLPHDAIGVIGGGRRKPKGQVDVALIQSLVRKGEVNDIVGNYGHLIVDECHHLSAVSFELVARRSKARYILGLSATVTRKDGHHPIIAMQCGPVRHRVDARAEAAKRPFDHVVRIRETSFQHQVTSNASPPSIQDVFKEMVVDEARNALIFDDVLYALEAGRSPVVITERTAHLEALAGRLKRLARHVIVLRGAHKARSNASTSQRGLPRFHKLRNASLSRLDAILVRASTIPVVIPCSLPCRSHGKARLPSMRAGCTVSTMPGAR